MVRNKRIYLAIISMLFIALIALNHYSPKPIDWSATYNNQSKTPYACYMLNDMMSTLFPGQPIENNYDGFFVSLDSAGLEKKNVIAVTDRFEPDKFDLGALLKFVARGNNFFVSSTQFDGLFLDTLKIRLSSSVIDTSTFKQGKDVVFLLNPQLKNESGYFYDKKMPVRSIIAYDSINTSELGTNRTGKLNFIAIRHGLGKIYFHTQPLVFTNYHLINGNVEYAAKVLSYLPVQKTVWDNYYKLDRYVNDSPMRYILSQDSLQAAYYLLLLTLLLYLVIESKRRQRVIPVLKPLENRSLQFVKTMGGLYFRQQNNTNLTQKKTIYFKEFLREHYFLINISTSDDCVAAVSAKSGVPAKQVQELLKLMDFYESAEVVSEVGLSKLNHQIEQFYKQCL